LPPFGRGSRVVIAGPGRSGRSALLALIAAALAGTEGLDVELLAVGVRPEELSEYKTLEHATSSGLSFAASSDAQEAAVEQAAERGRRIALRGGDSVLLIDTLDGLGAGAARRTMASARNLRGACSPMASSPRSIPRRAGRCAPSSSRRRPPRGRPVSASRAPPPPQPPPARRRARQHLAQGRGASRSPPRQRSPRSAIATTSSAAGRCGRTAPGPVPAAAGAALSCCGMRPGPRRARVRARSARRRGRAGRRRNCWSAR